MKYLGYAGNLILLVARLPKVAWEILHGAWTR